MNNLKEKGRFRLLTTRIVSFMMAFFMVFTTVMSAMSSTAYAASQYGDPVTLTIKDAEHGELSFDGSNSKKITVQRGSNVSVLVKPEVGYEAKTVKMDGENPMDLPVLNGQVNVPAIKDAVLSASFIQTEQSKVATVKEDNKENKTEKVKKNETGEQLSKEERIEGLRENLKENAKEDKKIVDEFNLESMQRDKDGVKVMYTPMNDKAIDEVVEKVEHITNESIKEMGDEFKPYINDMPEYVDGLLWLRTDDFYNRLQRSVKFLGDTNFLNEDAKKAIDAGKQLPLSVTIDKELLKKYNLSGAYEATLAIKFMSTAHYAMLDKRSRNEVNKLIDLNYKDTFPVLDMDKYTKYLSGLKFNSKTGKYTHHFSNGIFSDLFGGISALDFYKFSKYIGKEPENLLDDESLESFKEVQKAETNKSASNAMSFGNYALSTYVLSSGNIYGGDPTNDGWMKLNLDVIEGENNYVKGIGSRAGTYQTIYFSPTGNIGSERVVMYCIMGNTEHLKGGKGYAYIYTTPYFLQYDAPKQAEMFKQGGPDMDWITASSLGDNPVRRLAVMSSYLEILQRGLGWNVDPMYDALNLLLTTGGTENPFDNPKRSFTKPKDSYHWGSGADESAKAQAWVDEQAKANGGTAVKPGWPGAGSSGFRWLVKKGTAPVDWNSTDKSAIRPLFEGRSWQRTPYIMAYQYGTRGGVSGYGGQSKISGGLWQVKSDDTLEIPEAAKLRVIKTSANTAITQNNDNYNMAGATYSYSGSESGTLTIGSNGKSDYVDVKPGTYTIVETSAPQGYKLNTTPKTVTVADGESTTVTMDGSAAEKPIFDRLSIKIDKVVNGKKPNNFDLSGFEFTLSYTKNGFGSESATWKTDSNGRIDFGSEPSRGSWAYKDGGRNVFPLGQYTIRETKAIPGVRLTNPLMSSFSVVDAGGTAVKRFNSGLFINSDNSTVDNDLPQMGVKVTKLDDNFRTSTEQGDGSLVGVTYQIINRSGRPIISKNTGIENNGVIATIKTVKQGNSFVATSDTDLLPMGSYEIREIDPSTGYLNGNFVQRFNINESNMNKGGIMDLNGPGRENAIMRGSVEITKADFDWKKSSPEGDADLSNVEYNIINKSKQPVFVNGKTYNNNQVVTTIKTVLDSSGNYVAKIPARTLPYGTYDIVEVKTSEGYLNANWKKTFTIRSNNQVVKFSSSSEWNENKVMRGGVEVIKADFDWKKSNPQGDSDLSNVEYNIINKSKHSVYVNGKTYKNGEVITTIKTTLDNGKYVAKLANNVLPYGTYQITEVKPSVGYLNANWSQTFSIRKDKEVKKFDSSSNRWNENKVMRGGLEVVKADFDWKKSSPQGDADLLNVEYKVINKSKHPVYVNGKTYKNGETITTIKTSLDNGRYVAKLADNTLPYGTYDVVEIKSSVGYLNANWKQTFSIRFDKEVKKFDSTSNKWNENKVMRGGLEVTKADFDLHKSIPQGDADLENTEYKITNKSKQPVFVNGQTYGVNAEIMKVKAHKQSDGTYKVVLANNTLPYGSYNIEEVLPSSTYNKIAFSKDFKIRKDKEVIKFNTQDNWSENKVQRGGLEVTKADHDLHKSVEQGDATLLNTEYTVINRSKLPVYVNGKVYKVGDTIMNIKTEKVNGVYKAIIPNETLPIGTYQVKEVNPPVGYNLLTFDKTFKIIKDKQMVTFNDVSNWSENAVKRGGLEVTKSDHDWHKSSEQGDATLENTEYEVINKSKMPVFVNGTVYKQNEKIMNILSKKQKDGTYKAIVPNNTLPYGTYQVRETKAPIGYNLLPFDKTFTIRAQDEIAKFNDVNTWSENAVKRGGLEVTKADHDLHQSIPQGDANLEDTEYKITNKSKQPVFVNGKTYEVGKEIMRIKVEKQKDDTYKAIVPNNTLPYGTYNVSETTPSSTYNKIAFSKDFSIREEKQVIKYNDVKNWSENKVKRGGFEVTKADHDLHQSVEQGDATLENTEYTIINRSKLPVYVNGKVYKVGETIMNIKTAKQKDGIYKAIIKNETLPIGTYQIKEVAPPVGYNLITFDKIFKITEDKQIIEFNDAKTWSENAVKRGGLEITKADFDLHKSIPQGDADLEDTEYAIVNKSKMPVFVNGVVYKVDEEIMRVKAHKQKDGIYKAIIPDNTLPYGTYNVYETKSSSTYNMLDKQHNFNKTFSIREEKQVVKFNELSNWSENKVQRGGLEITKADNDLHKSVEQGDATLEDTEYTIINRSKLPVFVNGKVYKVGDTIMNFKSKKQKDEVYKAIIPNETLPIGTYQVKEVNPPVGYNLIPFDKTFKIVKDKQMMTYNQVSDWSENAVKRGGFEVTKADFDLHKSISQGDADLENTEYAITNKSKMPVFVNGKLYKVNEEIMRIKAHKQKDGVYKAIIGNNVLPYGTYNITETAPSSTYNKIAYSKTFSIREEKQVIKFNDAKTWSENKVKRGGLEITKADNDLHKSVNQGDATLENTEYTLINKSKLPVFVNGQLIKVGETVMNIQAKKQKDGTFKAIVPNETLPIGTYQVREVQPSEGYNMLMFDKTFRITEDKQIIKYNDVKTWSENKIKRGGLEVTKADYDLHKSIPQGDADLANTEYAITNKSKMPVFVNGKVHKVNDVIMTIKTEKDSKGVYKAVIANGTLPYGTYNITETKASSTYNKIDFSKDFKIREDNQMITFNDVKTWSENKVKRGGLEITKADFDLKKSIEQGDATLENTEYTVINKSKLPVFVNGKVYKVNDTIMTINTKKQKDGVYKAIIPNETLPIGTYQVKETKASKGYNLVTFDKTFKITEDKQMIKYNDVKTWSENKVIRGGFKFEKIDREIKQPIGLGQATLEGVKFKVVNRSKMPVVVNGKLVKVGETALDVEMKLVKDKDGKPHYIYESVKNTLPYGTYEAIETATGNGYLLDESQKFTFKIVKEGEIVDLTSKPVTNQVIREDFHFIKKDAETMERMANVPFVITSKTTGESHIIVTDENGEFNSSAWQTNETKGIKHSENTNINDRNGAVVKDSKGNYKVVKPNLLKSRTGVWFTGTDPAKTKWAKDGKSYTFNGVTVKVDDGLRAFPYDIYTIQELRSESNKGHKLIKATVVLHDYGDVKSRGIDLDYGTIDNTPVYLKSELTSKLTGSHTVENSESATIVDRLFFNNFDTKEELTVKSELRVVDKDGKDHGLAAEKTTKFKADMPNSTFDIVFENVNTKKYAGMNLVAIQTVLDKHGVLVSHADLKDKKQTVSIPEMRTTAKGDIDNEANAYAKTVKIKDTITYKNLEVGKTVNIHTDLHYKNVGELGKITDGGIVKDRNGKNVSVDKKFTPKKSDGTFEVEFEFEPDEKLAGHDTVVFEYAKYGDVEFMSHADIEDEHQTIKFPKLKTKASDQKDEDKYVGTSENEVVRDVVTVENLVKGKEYTVSGFAHIKTYDKDGKAKDEGIAKDKDGKDSYAETTFKATDTKMQVELLFNVDARKLHGRDLVMFEELSRDKVKLAIEANIENEEQTVHIVKVGTTLIDKNTNSHMVYKEAKEKNYKVTLVDTMKYENLTPGQKIKVTGQLYTNENGKAVEVRDVNGQLVQKTVEVEVKERNGIVEIPFEFEMKSDSDIKNFVAFERVYDAKTNLLIGSEEDINNKGQTVYVINIKTTLTGADGKSKDVKASKNIDLIDTVEYGDELTVGEEYTMIGELHLVKVDKDGKLIDGGKISEAKTKFKAKKEKGTVEVIFKGVDTEKLEDGTKLVAFEKLEYNGKIIAQHEDINDEGQTVVVKKESKTKEKTRIRLNTGAGKAIGIVSGLVVVFAIGAGYAVSKRRKDA